MNTIKKYQSIAQQNPYVEGFNSIFNLFGVSSRFWIYLRKSRQQDQVDEDWQRIGQDFRASINKLSLE